MTDESGYDKTNLNITENSIEQNKGNQRQVFHNKNDSDVVLVD